MEYLEDRTDTGPLEGGFYRFKSIKDHKGPYTSSDPAYNGSSYNLLIERETGEQPWETKDNNKWKEATVYDKKHITNAPKGHQKIRVHFIFDVKHCGKFKARLLADGHFTKEPMETVYSGMFLTESPITWNYGEQMLDMHTTFKHSQGRNFTLWVVLNIGMINSLRYYIK